MALSKIDGTNLIAPTLPVASGGTGSTTLAGAGLSNTPAFEAYLGTDGGQTISENTIVTAQMNTEVFDVGGCYNNTGSAVTLNGISVPAYSFLPNVAGKYSVHAGILLDDATNSNIDSIDIFFYNESGSIISQTNNRFDSNPIRTASLQIYSTLVMNGTSNSVQVRARANMADDTNPLLEAYQQWRRATYFGAYKIIT